MLAKMKKGPCWGIALALAFCFLYVVTETWPLSGGGGEGTASPLTEQQQQQQQPTPLDLLDANEGALPLNYPHPTETLNEGLFFRYFDTDVTFQTEGVAGRLLTQHEHALLSTAKDAATQYLTQLHPNTAFVSGRYRWLPGGVEYDLLYKDQVTDVSSRVTLFQKLDAPKVIRSITVDEKTVYYPVVFSLYNPKLVYPLFDKVVPPVSEQLAVDEQSGFWRTFGFGMACMFRRDYGASGGFPDIRTWGGEDVALYQQFLKLDNIKVIRAPDPSLFHLYHHKECTDTTSTSYVACLKSKAVTEGSQLQLGLSLLKLHQGTDLEGVLSKRFYYFWLVPYLGLLLAVSLLTNLVQAVMLFFNRRIRSFRTV
ncbi:uncharacterized protein [Procambarus clarkii]|uniref:uncharacterized protein isoform X2 n=1 Tax=Procambarus clarkii TaxID=6728 RepID=UPI003743B561